MAGQTILIVEDDPDIRDGVRILLSGEGYHILEAENGLRALELFNPEVDLVILDIMMPGMSGLRVCEELRKSSVPGSRHCCAGTASIWARSRHRRSRATLRWKRTACGLRWIATGYGWMSGRWT